MSLGPYSPESRAASVSLGKGSSSRQEGLKGYAEEGVLLSLSEDSIEGKTCTFLDISRCKAFYLHSGPLTKVILYPNPNSSPKPNLNPTLILAPTLSLSLTLTLF
jgi:hypothetical protein